MSYHNDHDEDAVEQANIKTIPVASILSSRDEKDLDDDDTTSESESESESEADSTSDEEAGFLSDSIADTESPSESDSDSEPGPDPATSIARAAAAAAAASGPKLADRLAAFLPRLAEANAKLSAGETGMTSKRAAAGFEIAAEEEDGDDTIEEDSDDDGDSEGDTLSDNEDETSTTFEPAQKGSRKRKQPYIEMSLDLGILEATTGGEGQLVENAAPETGEETTLMKDGVRLPLKRPSSGTDEAETGGNGVQSVGGAEEEQRDGDGILDALLHPSTAAGPSKKRRKMAKVGIVEVV